MKNLRNAKTLLAFIIVAAFTVTIGTLSSLAPVTHLSTFIESSLKLKKIDNPTNIPDSIYDNFEGGTYSWDLNSDGQISPNGKWKAVYTGYGTMGVATA